MALLTEDITTASHRPFVGLPALLVEQQIMAAAEGGAGDERSPAPTGETVKAVVNLVAELPARLIGEFDVSLFYGEVHVSWAHGAKQIVLISFPDRTPLIHHYRQVPGANSAHGIDDASAQSLAQWLDWLRL